jgi:hypothetical protein
VNKGAEPLKKNPKKLSVYRLSHEAVLLVKKASAETGRSEADIVDHCIVEMAESVVQKFKRRRSLPDNTQVVAAFVDSSAHAPEHPTSQPRRPQAAPAPKKGVLKQRWKN